MTQPLYLNNFTLAESKGINPVDNFPHYLYDISTTAMNSQFFRMSRETLDSIARQANAGVPVMKSHNTYNEDPSGYTVSAKRIGNKVQAELYIQPDLSNPDTNDIIARLNAGTMRDGSIQFRGGDFISDIDGTKFKYESDGWFYSFKSKGGHYLGQELDDGRIVTAQVKGEVNLQEFSVAWKGADPGATQVKKLHEEFGNEPIDVGILHALAEINGFDTNTFCLQLGFDNHKSVKSFSFPTPLAEAGDNTGETIMANNADLQALQEQVTTITAERDALQEQVTTLTAELEAIPREEIPLLQNRISELETEKETLKTEVDRVKTLAAAGEQALKIAKTTAKRSVLVNMGLNPAEDHSDNFVYTKRLADIDAMTDITAINSIAESNFGSGHTGRKSSINGYQHPMGTGKKPAHSGANAL